MASYASNQSTAIDYQRFAPEPQTKKQPSIEILPEQKKSKKQHKASIPYMKYCLIFGCVFAVLAVIITGNMHMTSLTSQNARMQAEITRLRGEEASLNVKKEQMYPLSFVEGYAKNVLGMVKLDKKEIIYVELSNPEKLTISQPESKGSDVFAALAKSFSAVLEYLN